MITRSKKSAKISQEWGDSCMKKERKTETETEHSLLPFPSPSEFQGLETSIQVENYTESDGDHVANIVKSELLEFHSNGVEESFRQNDTKTVLYEKIPKTETETEILGDYDEPPFSNYEEVDDPFNNDTFGNSHLNPDPDPELDPFADVESDPSFSSKIPKSRNFNDSATLQVQIIKNEDELNFSSNPSPAQQSVFATGVSLRNKRAAATQIQLINATGVKASLNPPSSSLKSTVPTTVTISQYHRRFVTVDSKFRCQLCLELRYSKNWLQSHMETCAKTHKNRYRFCVPCNRLFTSSAGRRGHSLRIHGETMKFVKLNPFPFKCQFCACAFALRECLVPHLAAHPEVNTTDEEDLKRTPYICQECPLTFRHYSVYTGHIMLHKNERAFKCPHCEKAFKNKFNLKNHLQQVHSEDRPFQCCEPNCGRSFKTNGQLEEHVICHSDDTPFKCPHSDCSEALKSKRRLREHSLFHSEAFRLQRKQRDELRIFKCSEPGCYAAYKIQGSLQSHINQKHKQSFSS